MFANLPNDLVIRCLALLPQSERFKHISLVSQRLRQLCLSPELVRTVSVTLTHRRPANPSQACPLHRAASLHRFLETHAAHVCSLELHLSLHRSLDGPSSAQLAALLHACMAACAAKGQLEHLVVRSSQALGSTDWLPALTSLRRLELRCPGHELQLPEGLLVSLTALTEAALEGSPMRLVAGDHCTTAPVLLEQPPSLPALTRLHLSGPCDSASLSLLSNLPALRHLAVGQCGHLSPAPSCAGPLLERLVIVCDSFNAASLEACLPRLSGLTTLCIHDSSTLCLRHKPDLAVLMNRDPTMLRFPPALAQLPRLQRLLLDVVTRRATDFSLPHGPWLHTIKWLSLPALFLQAGAGTLASAPQLQNLCSIGAPHAAASLGGPERDWQPFWELAASHPPLCCLGVASLDAACPAGMAEPLLALSRRRPALRLRKVRNEWSPSSVSSILSEAVPCM